MSLALMFGNFSQHIFIHPDLPELPQNKRSMSYNCALTIQCMNHFDNAHSFNDGYHVTHHYKAGLHWTEMAFHFLQNLEEYVAADVLVFDGLGFFDVGLCV